MCWSINAPIPNDGDRKRRLVADQSSRLRARLTARGLLLTICRTRLWLGLLKNIASAQSAFSACSDNIKLPTKSLEVGLTAHDSSTNCGVIDGRTNTYVHGHLLCRGRKTRYSQTPPASRQLNCLERSRVNGCGLLR